MALFFGGGQWGRRDHAWDVWRRDCERRCPARRADFPGAAVRGVRLAKRLTGFAGTVAYFAHGGVPLPFLAAIIAVVANFLAAFRHRHCFFTRPVAVLLLALYTPGMAIRPSFLGCPGRRGGERDQLFKMPPLSAISVWPHSPSAAAIFRHEQDQRLLLARRRTLASRNVTGASKSRSGADLARYRSGYPSDGLYVIVPFDVQGIDRRLYIGVLIKPAG